MPADNLRVPDQWKGVEEAVARVVSDTSDSFDPATLANVHDLVQACRGSCPAPEETAKGYWSTICLSWEGLEIEVFQDRYEFYRFEQGHTDIEEFSHTPGAIVPARLVSYLPKRSSLRD
jgi:hypothetical protein